jgi:outer membrane protein TolC
MQRIIRRVAFPLLLISFLGGSAVAQQQRKGLTLQDCIHLAEGAPSAVRLAQQEREIADRDVVQARAGFLPQAELLSNFTYNSPRLDDPSTFSFIPLNAIREYSLLGSVHQEFDTSGRLRAEMSRARANQDIAHANLEITRRDLRKSVTIAYYRLLLTRQLIGTISDMLKESQSFAERTRVMFEGGEAARADLVKARAQVAFLQQALNAADLEARLANQDLASFWTRDADEPLQLADALDEALPAVAEDLASGDSRPFLRRLEFTLLDAQRKGFEADARRARGDLLPQLSFLFQYGQDYSSLEWRNRGYAAYVNLRIPLFDWFHAKSQKQQFELRVKQVDTNRAVTERNLSHEYLSARARAQQLFRQIALTHEQVRLSEEDLRLSRARYEGGEGPALDVVAAQNQLAQARNNYYTSLANYLTARIELEVASGK